MSDKINASLFEKTDSSTTVAFTNSSSETINAILLLSAYDLNDRMINVSMQLRELKPGEVCPITIKHTGYNNVATIKGYTLEKATLIPLETAWMESVADDS